AYLEAALEDGDPAVIAASLGDIARAKGMTKVARKAGLGRESLYKALSRDGNPELGTVLRVLSAVGVRLRAFPAAGRPARRRSQDERDRRILARRSRALNSEALDVLEYQADES